MTDKRKRACDWNHISDKLKEEQIMELNSYYYAYHKKQWCYKAAFKRLKKWKLASESSSVIFATGGVTSAIAISGVNLIAISTASIFIQVYMKHKNVERKLNQSKYPHGTNGHLLNEIKDILRSGEFNPQELYNKIQIIDDFILDNSPLVDKWVKKYDKIFTY